MMIKLDVTALFMLSGNRLTQVVVQWSIPLSLGATQITLLVLRKISVAVLIVQVNMTMLLP